MSCMSPTGPMYCDASAFIMGSARYLPSHYGAVPVVGQCVACSIFGCRSDRIPAIGRSVAGPSLVAVCRVAVCDAGEAFGLSVMFCMSKSYG